MIEAHVAFEGSAMYDIFQVFPEHGEHPCRLSAGEWPSRRHAVQHNIFRGKQSHSFYRNHEWMVVSRGQRFLVKNFMNNKEMS